MQRRLFPILSALSLLLLFGGCYKYEPVEVHVYDALTEEPLEGVRVEASVRYVIDPFHPKKDRAVTDKRGIALVRVCTNYSDGGDTAYLIIRDDVYVLDHPMPSGLVHLPLGPVRASAPQPYRMGVSLLTIGDWRQRYDAK